MEESTELQSEENQMSTEKNNKRRLKTPAQLMALEIFYNDHKYPTEEMKLELADKIALTEKQISGWFCHRRLKDKKLLKGEACTNGRQDRSSGVVIQDLCSGLVQDSCGSTKHGDYRYRDPKEVESHGLYNHDISVADMTYGQRNLHKENDSATDNTSSESSSSLQEPSRYLMPNGALPPLNPKNAGYKPSGYLKVKGEIEHAAITAVKKRLGRHYEEDGPLLTVEFDTIPPGAFEYQTADPVNDPYYVVNPGRPNSPEVSAMKRQSSLSSRYDSYPTKLSSQDSHIAGGDFGSLRDSDFQEKKAHQHVKQRPMFHSHTNHFPGKNSSQNFHVDSTEEAYAYNSSKKHRLDTKHGVGVMRSDAASNRSDPYEDNNHAVRPEDPLLHDYDNSNLKNVQRSEYVKSKPSNSLHHSRISVDTEERGLLKKMTKEEKINGERKVKKHRDADGIRMLSNEMMVTKRAKVNLHQQYDGKQAPVAAMEPRSIQRSAAEMTSSFSEDETAETSSSLG